MALTAKEESDGGKTFDPVAAGVYPAVCYLVADLGTHYDGKWDKHKHEIAIGWEIPELRLDMERDGKKVDFPQVISRIFTLSLNDKAHLRHILEAWRGKPFSDDELNGFDLKNILGVPCMIQVMHREHNGKTYANVANVIPSRETLTAENPLQWFSIEEGLEIPENIPEWLVKKIKVSEEMTAPKDDGGFTTDPNDNFDVGAPAEDSDDNLPF